MRILMLETRRGSGDGFTVRCYEAGEIYDLPSGLARSFIAEGSAILTPEGTRDGQEIKPMA